MSFCLSHVHYFDLDSIKRSIPEAGRYRDDRTVGEIPPSLAFRFVQPTTFEILVRQV